MPENTDSLIATALRRYLAIKIQVSANARTFFRISGFREAVYQELLGALAQQTWRLAEKDLLVCSIDPIPGFPEQALAPHRSATWYRNTVQDGQALILIQNRRSTDAQSLKDLFSVTEMTISQDGIHALLDTCMSRYQLNTEANQRDEIIHFVRRFAKVIHEPQLRDLVEFLVEVDRSMAEQPGMDVRHALAAALPWLGLFRCKELATLKSTHSDKLLRQVWNAARIGDEVLEEPQYSNYIKRLEQVTFDDLNGVSAAQKRRLLASFIAGELRNDRDAQLEVLKIDWNEVKQIVLNKTRNTAQQKIATLATQIQALAEEGTLGGDDVQEVLDDLRNSTEPDPETLDRLLIEQGDALPKRLKTDLQRLVKPRTQRHADFLVGVVSVALTLLVPNQNDLAVGTKLQVQVNLPKGKKDSHLTEACATFRTLYGGIEQEWDQLEWNLKALWDQSEQDPSGEEEAAQNEAEQEREIREEIPFRLILLGPDGKERSRAELIWIYRADSPAGATHQTLLAERKQIGVTEPLRLRVPIFNTCPESSVIDDLDISRPIRSFGAWFEQANSLADLLERSLHKRAQPATWQVVSEALRNLEQAWAAFVQSSQAGLLAARVEPLLNAYEHLLDRVISTFQSGNEISYGYRVLNQAWMISHPDEPNWALMPLFHPLKLLWWRERSRYFSQILDRLLDPATPASIVDESRFRRELRATYGSSGFPPLIALPFKEGKPAEYFVAAEESDGYELFFREAQRAESFGMDSEELADDEQEIAAQHAVEGIAAVIQDYIETYPFVRDGLEIVLFECRNGALPGLLIERLHQISKRRDWQVRITMVVHTSDRGAPIFRRVSEWVERERLPSSREVRTYFPAITLQVMQETSHTALFQRCADSDLIILADVLAERGQRMSAKIDLDPATDSKQYLLTYRAQQEPFQAGELQRSMLLTPPQQPRISRLFMLSQYAAIERRKVQPHQQARFYREMSLEAWQPEISTMHDHFNWVVCYDPTIDRFLIESTFPDQVQIIRYSLGLGAKRQHNLTVSSSHKAQDIVVRRLASRLGQMLERHDSSDLLQHVAQRLVEKAKLISGDIVLRAAGPGMFLNELIGLVSAKFATEERYRAQHPDTLSAWILLDDVEHWFSGKFPDLLFVAITTTENGQLKLHLEVIEAKCIGEQAFEAEARDAQRQVLSGIRRISSAFASGAQHLDALNWYDQLYRAVVGNLQVGIDHEEVWNLFREHLHRGDFELDLSGHTWIFCYDGQAGISNGPSEDPFGKGESDLDLRAHHYGRNELFALLRRLIEQHEGPSPDPEVWTPRQEASFPPPNLPPLGGGTELPPPAGAGGGDEVSVPPPNLPPLGGGTELPPGGGTELPPPAGAGRGWGR
ncbi:hypothetical protein OSCT_2509 [Oscillochloris trichoides DG-6]|uniref:Uncharacterized protein n=1 Tax=Oscillochloris trichoides DG-6 TaxID=765420 RepID=E1IGQ8_9CHLR|nr:hypothetical protein [Oscillochloris trichoides]EFO79645.1 hypothetical protein OSCT_2509 [Oscillochloris trichoides DG-6]